MAVKIRLNRVGAKNQPYYRVVVTDSKSARGSRYIEIIGQYNPLAEKDKLDVDKNKILDWIKKGAKPTFTVRKLLGKVGILKPLDLSALPKRPPKSQAKTEETKAAEAPKREETTEKQAAPKEEKKEEKKEQREGEKKEEKKDEKSAKGGSTSGVKEEPKQEEKVKQGTEPPK